MKLITVLLGAVLLSGCDQMEGGAMDAAKAIGKKVNPDGVVLLHDRREAMVLCERRTSQELEAVFHNNHDYQPFAVSADVEGYNSYVVQVASLQSTNGGHAICHVVDGVVVKFDL